MRRGKALLGVRSSRDQAVSDVFVSMDHKAKASRPHRFPNI